MMACANIVRFMLIVYVAGITKAHHVTSPSPAVDSWSDPTFRDIKAEELRRERYALAARLSVQFSEQTYARADRINARLAICDATNLKASTDAGRIRSYRSLNTLAKELMADHVDEATRLSRESPNHYMISTFLLGVSQHAEHAWDTRGPQTELPGPFGGLQYLAWLLSRSEAKLGPPALPFLDNAVQLARAIPTETSLRDWRQTDVQTFLQAWRAAGQAASVKDV